MRHNTPNPQRARQLPCFLLTVLLMAAALLFLGMRSGRSETQALKVAAASDLQFAFTELGRTFQKKTGRKVTFSFGSTGNLARQIAHGAPFDAFFAANEQFVEGLEDQELLAPGTRRLYAIGRIVLASNLESAAEVDALADLLDPRIKRVAIANPAHAPYGLAAKQSLQKAGLWERLQPKLVLGENIRQTLQFIQTGNADAGIVALSVANAPKVRYRKIDPKTHSPLRQAAAVIRRTSDAPTARRFINFVCSNEGQAVMKRYGFLPPVEH